MTNSLLTLFLVLFFASSIYVFVVSKRIIQKFRNKTEENSDNSSTIILGLSVLLLIFIIPWLLTSFFGGKIEDFKETGPIGDTFGGLTAPFIGGLSAILVYLALKAQIDANKLVNKQFELQQIESRFFELLKLHRDNVAEIGIGEAYGKKIFVTLIREFRLIHFKLRRYNEQENFKLTKEQLIEISYLILFFGFGPNSSRQLKLALNNYDDYLFHFLEHRFDNRASKNAAKQERGFSYIPFEGHQSRLGHYFRHLYQTVDFIHNRETEIDKYSYIKALRAQLTTHEQALLYLNSKSKLGKKWWDKKYIITYKIVKNIPNGFFDAEKEIDLEKEFPENYFEYQTTEL